MVKKLSELFLEARRVIAQSQDLQTAGSLARDLICHVTGKTREQFLLDKEMYASDAVMAKMGEAVQRCAAGEPMAYILGEWDFYGMTLQVNPNVLIPRDDTCAVTSLAIKQALFLDSSPRILDL